MRSPFNPLRTIHTHTSSLPYKPVHAKGTILTTLLCHLWRVHSFIQLSYQTAIRFRPNVNSHHYPLELSKSVDLLSSFSSLARSLVGPSFAPPTPLPTELPLRATLFSNDASVSNPLHLPFQVRALRSSVFSLVNCYHYHTCRFFLSSTYSFRHLLLLFFFFPSLFLLFL